MAHFKAGRSYLLNTSKTHCATNYSATERIHLIASVGNIEQFTQVSNYKRIFEYSHRW